MWTLRQYELCNSFYRSWYNVFLFPDVPLPPVKFVKSGKEHYPLHVKWSLKLPRWSSSGLIAETLQHHANEGDFQTVACVLLVLGERRRYLTKMATIDEVTQEQWLLTYIEMLYRYKLWNIATKVRNVCGMHTHRVREKLPKREE